MALTRRAFLEASAAVVAVAALPLPKAVLRDETLEVKVQEWWDHSHQAIVLHSSASWEVRGELVMWEYADLILPERYEELVEERKRVAAEKLEAKWRAAQVSHRRGFHASAQV